MDARTREKPTDPMGVLGCIMTGFEMLGHNLWPLAFPLLLDLFLWLGPQLSVAPLMRWFISFSSRTQPTFDPQLALVLEQFGEEFNLFSLLSAVPLLTTPSLLAQHAAGTVSPLGERGVLPITNVLVLIAWASVLIPTGLVLGFVYLNSLAHSVYTHWVSKEEAHASGPATPKADEGAPTQQIVPAGMAVLNTALKLIRVLLFTVALLVVGMLLFPMWIAVVGMAMAVSQIAGMLMWGLSVGAASFFVIHLLFVVHGVLLGERRLLRAIWDSITLIRVNFLPSAGLTILAILIYKGLGYVWSLPPRDSWLLLVGILCNSGVATALITATFIFYHERIGHLAQMIETATKT